MSINPKGPVHGLAMRAPMKWPRLNGLTVPMAIAWTICCNVFAAFHRECLMTCATDGEHRIGSKHYSGNAIDLRTSHIDDEGDIKRIGAQLRTKLGPDFDVVVEPTHIHVEFDPKEPM